MTDAEVQIAEIARKHQLLVTSIDEIDWLLTRAFNMEAALQKIEFVAGGGSGCPRCLRIHEIAYRAREGKNWEDIDGRK